MILEDKYDQDLQGSSISSLKEPEAGFCCIDKFDEINGDGEYTDISNEPEVPESRTMYLVYVAYGFSALAMFNTILSTLDYFEA